MEKSIKIPSVNARTAAINTLGIFKELDIPKITRNNRNMTLLSEKMAQAGIKHTRSNMNDIFFRDSSGHEVWVVAYAYSVNCVGNDRSTGIRSIDIIEIFSQKGDSENFTHDAFVIGNSDMESIVGKMFKYIKNVA